MKGKSIRVVFYGWRLARKDWDYPFDQKDLESFLDDLAAELSPLGIELQHGREEDPVIDVRGYGDLLNAIRIRSDEPGLGNPCLGHVIGSSPARDLKDDLRRAVNRVAFAPETIEPDGTAKKVCHNCGCGC